MLISLPLNGEKVIVVPLETAPVCFFVRTSVFVPAPDPTIAPRPILVPETYQPAQYAGSADCNTRLAVKVVPEEANAVTAVDGPQAVKMITPDTVPEFTTDKVRVVLPDPDTTRAPAPIPVPFT
jgi:hypothetical protein